MVRPTPSIALKFLKGAEACRLKAYRDAGGIWTIAYGHTGGDVAATSTCSQAQADKWLGDDVAVAAGRLQARVREAVIASLSDHQYAALLSFVFNVGAAPDWTIWHVLNASALDQVPAQMLRFDKVRTTSGLRSVPGLAHRRAAEVALWGTGDAAAAAEFVRAAPVAAPPSSQTRAADTPPTPAVVAPLTRSGSFGAAIATAVAAGPVAIHQAQGGAQAISDAINPYADRSDLLQHAVGLLACVCAALAAITVAIQWVNHRKQRAS